MSSIIFDKSVECYEFNRCMNSTMVNPAPTQNTSAPKMRDGTAKWRMGNSCRQVINAPQDNQNANFITANVIHTPVKSAQ